ncbi:MAG: FAD-binding protein [Thermoplasmata archaeon]
MPVSIDVKNLSAACTADTRWSELRGAVQREGFFVPVQPLSEETTVARWLMEDLPSMGVLRYGTPRSAIRALEIETGSGARVTTGHPTLSDFSSSLDLTGLFLFSRGELGALRRAIFRLAPLGELRRLNFTAPARALPDLLGALGAAPGVYHIEFKVAGSDIALGLILEGAAELCAAAEKRISEIAERAGASAGAARGLYTACSAQEDWRLPTAVFRECCEELLAAGEFAGLVERGRVRLRASPPPKFAALWAEKGSPVGRPSGAGEGALRLSARTKRILDPTGKLCPGGELAAAARKLDDGAPAPLSGIRPAMREDQRAELRALVGEESVSFEFYDRLVCSHDLAPLPREVELVFKRVPDAVVLARGEEDVRKLVEFARSHGIPLVPRGGGSWGFGGCVPVQGGIVIDLSFMMDVDVNEEEQIAVCGPGATWEQVIRAAGRRGLTVGAFPGSAPVATVAGWLSTNGAGLCSYRYGIAVEQVAWVEAVMADGSEVSTRRAPLPLTALFAGAEGTLGIITKVAVRLRPVPERTRPLAYSAPSVEALSGALTALTRSPLLPLHISFFDGAHFRYLRLLGKDAPDVGAMALVVLEGGAEEVAVGERLLQRIMVEQGAERLPDEIAEHEWAERFYELRVRRLGPGGVLGEAVVPVGALGAVAGDVRRVAQELGMLCAINGVVVDRNTIALMPYFLTDERAMLRSLGGAMGFVKKVVDAGIAHGGRPSGLGIFFAGNMGRLHDAATSELISEIKRAIDPADIINPGKHTEMGTRYGISLPTSFVSAGMALMALLKRGMPDRLPSGEELEERLRGLRE